MDLPRGVGIVDRNLPASAGDMGSISGPGRFHMPWATRAHEPQLLSQHTATATTEGQASRAHVLQQEKPPQWEAQATQLESSPHSQQLEKALDRPATKSQCNQKLKLNKDCTVDWIILPFWAGLTGVRWYRMASLTCLAVGSMSAADDKDNWPRVYQLYFN